MSDEGPHRRGAGCAGVGCLGLGALPVVFVVGLLLMLGGGLKAACESDIGSGDGGALKPGQGIPPQAARLYKKNADRWNLDVAFLASIGAQESGHGTSEAAKQTNSSGCRGFMQLGTGGACGDYWGRNKCSPNANIDDPDDNICASAKGLRKEKGAPAAGSKNSYAGYRQAACNYYGACGDGVANYAEEVMRRAKTYGFPAAKSDGLNTGGDGREDDGAISASPADPAPSDTAPEDRDSDQADDEPRGGDDQDGDDKFVRPVPTRFPETSGFGPRGSPGGVGSTNHEGQDYGTPEGTPVVAAADGRVIFAGTMAGYGNYVCVLHQPKLQTCYAHLSRASVKVDDRVKRSQTIARSGSTGVGTGPHLHFEVRRSDQPGADPAEDPKRYIGREAPTGPGPGENEQCPV